MAEKGSSRTILAFLAALVCCALPLLLIVGGTTLLAGILSRKFILTVLGLLFLLVIVSIYIGRRSEE